MIKIINNPLFSLEVLRLLLTLLHNHLKDDEKSSENNRIVSNTITTQMEASDLIGTQWTCPQCKTNEVINATGIDHKCSNCHIIVPLDSVYLRWLFFKNMYEYCKIPQKEDFCQFLESPLYPIKDDEKEYNWEVIIPPKVL